MKKDVIIVGAGIIGMSLALSLSKKNKRVLLLEKDLKRSHLINRIYSISNKSKDFFKELNIWSGLNCINDINKMKLFYRNFHDKNNLSFYSEKQKIGYIAQSVDITNALLKQVTADKNIELIDKVNLKNVIERDENSFELESSESGIYKADYIFSCEGSNSFLKDQLNIKNSIKDYDSKALVFSVQHENSNDNSAYQVFLESGPIAFLPVSNNEFSMVISVKNKFYDSSLYCKENLPNYLNEVTNGFFGKMNIPEDIINFGLFGYNLDNYKHKNILFVGDSAHSVHPLAGMGLNLGLSDIIEIIKAFEINTYKYGHYKFFDKYIRKQKIVNSQAIQQLELIEKFYAFENSFIGNLLIYGMSVINKSNFLKKNITNHANQNLSFFH